MIKYRKPFGSQNPRRVNENRRHATRARKLYEYYGMSDDVAYKLKKQYGFSEFPQVPILIIDNMLLEADIEDMAYQEVGDDGEITDELRAEMLERIADEERRIIENSQYANNDYSPLTIHYPYDTDWCLVVSLDKDALDISDFDDLPWEIRADVNYDDYPSDEEAEEAIRRYRRDVADQAETLLNNLKLELGKLPAFLVK